MASGFAALDAELPGGGWPRGALTEFLVNGVGLGELGLLMPALCAVRAEGGWSLLGRCALSALRAGLERGGSGSARLVVVSPAAERDALWATEQALASAAPRAVLCWTTRADARAVRRLQVAAATGGAAAFLFRPARMAVKASAAPLRCNWQVRMGGLAVRILKRRGPPLSSSLNLAILNRHASAQPGLCA